MKKRRCIKDKRGVETLIAYVLLIGFTIAIAAFVSTWVIKQVKEFKPEEAVGGDIYCEDVSLSIRNICYTECKETYDKNYIGEDCQTCFLKATVVNKGAFTIKNIRYFTLNWATNDIKNFDLEPGLEEKEFPLTVCLSTVSSNEIKIIPGITREGKDVFCIDKAVVLTDEMAEDVKECLP